MTTATHASTTPYDELFASLSARVRPEDAADAVLRLLSGSLEVHEKATIFRAARGSLRRNALAYSSMATRFAAPSGLVRQAKRAAVLFPTVPALAERDAADPTAVEDYLRVVGRTFGKTFGASDFLHDRLDSAARAELGLELSRRRYNRGFRMLRRMERKLAKLVRERRKAEFTRVGKSGLASSLSRADFGDDPDTIAFVAYYVARCNLRSEFTVFGQERPFDEIAQVLYRRCLASTRTSFFAIAHVLPTQEVLARLDDAQKGELLGRWHGLLTDIAELLAEVFDAGGIDPRTMVVRRGNDSTTWNNTVRAWNTARAHWMALLRAMGAEDLLEAFCPGKAMALIAADVAAWHRAVGHADNPELEVFARLPRPWEVLSGKASCTRADVERACAEVGVDPVATGWTAPRTLRVTRFKPTPELVHGVTVGHPGLALVLRKAGVFSGKEVKWS